MLYRHALLKISPQLVDFISSHRHSHIHLQSSLQCMLSLTISTFYESIFSTRHRQTVYLFLVQGIGKQCIYF